MDGDEKKQIIEDAGHNEWHGRYRNPGNAPIPTGWMGIKKWLFYSQEEEIAQEGLLSRTKVQDDLATI